MSSSQQSAMSNSVVENQSVGQVHNSSSTTGSTSQQLQQQPQQHKKNSKSQNPNQVLKHIKYNTGQIKKIN